MSVIPITFSLSLVAKPYKNSVILGLNGFSPLLGVNMQNPAKVGHQIQGRGPVNPAQRGPVDGVSSHVPVIKYTCSNDGIVKILLQWIHLIDNQNPTVLPRTKDTICQ
jgi:hypothetical protein